jgi:hypothetical protein
MKYMIATTKSGSIGFGVRIATGSPLIVCRKLLARHA